MNLLALTWSLVLSLGVAPICAAQDRIPAGNVPVRLIVGFRASEAADVLARLLAYKLQDELNTSVIVENRSGAGGQLAAEYAKRLAPDGMTVLLADTHMMVMAPLTHEKIRYEPLKDFTAVGRAASRQDAIAVPTGLSIANVSIWLANAGKDESKATYGVPVVGGMSQFIGYWLGSEHGTDLLPVTYRGSNLLANDLAAGRIAAGILPVADALPYYRGGRLHVLAVNGARRAPSLPDVPTLNELGWAQFDSLEWYGLFVPQGTPRDLIEQWNRALAKVLASGEIKGQLLKIGMQADPSTPEAMQAQLADDLFRWRPVVKASGFAIK
jgi:tripartite-type tricarboxylate transporter receptor subunit TctC